MDLQAERLLLRTWREEDAESLSRYADNPNVGANMGSVWPSPYTLDDARKWIATCLDDARRDTRFAIDIGGEAVGAIGYDFLDEVRRYKVEFGYWLGEPFWGRGIATEAVRRISRHLFEDVGVVRIEARVFEWNVASARVLENAGFSLEGRLVKGGMKHGRIVDLFLYALAR
jgi:ribosomal-protein-alanine N-acetyltransferase